MINIILLLGLATFLGSVAVCRPEYLSENKFLVDFVDHEAIALLAVILTITLASVANIHLSINRVLLRTQKKQDLLEAAKMVKSETKDDAWYIFFGFIASLLLVIWKGGTSSTDVLAIIHAAMIWIFGLYLVCMYDIHKIIFGLADLEMEL
ncbi:MAG: hypothetical protein ACU0AU_04125 [Cognatishimia activa]